MTKLIRAFCDESSNGAFVMAAWVASAETWGPFADAWDSELGNTPSIKYFKHYEAKQHEKQFEGWDENAIDNKIMALAKVICKHKPLYGISTGLIVKKLREEIGKSKLPKKKLRKVGIITEPYEYCFINTACRVLQIQLERGISDRVDFIFDEHALFEKCASLYREMKEGGLPAQQKAIAGTVSPAVDTEVPALQAGDLLAGQMTTELRWGRRDDPLEMLRSNIDIYIAPTPLPRHIRGNEIIEDMNVLWSASQKIKGK
jgi:hypothetical protein